MQRYVVGTKFLHGTALFLFQAQNDKQALDIIASFFGGKVYKGFHQGIEYQEKPWSYIVKVTGLFGRIEHRKLILLEVPEARTPLLEGYTREELKDKFDFQYFYLEYQSYLGLLRGLELLTEEELKNLRSTKV